MKRRRRFLAWLAAALASDPAAAVPGRDRWAPDSGPIPGWRPGGTI